MFSPQDNNNPFSVKLLEDEDVEACSLLSYCPEFHQLVNDAKEALRVAGLNVGIELGVAEDSQIIREPDCDFGLALEEVKKATRNANHAFYKGSFYVLSDGGKWKFHIWIF